MTIAEVAVRTAADTLALAAGREAVAQPLVPPLAVHLADGLLAPVLEAGRLQLRIRAEGAVVTTKGDSSPVTRADQESEAIIVAALQRLAPGVPVVAEEAMYGGDCPIGRESTCSFFLVDPLDGTREYIDNGDDFTINVALIEGGRPTFGLVYAPALAELYVTLAPDQTVYAEVAPASSATSLADLTLRRLQTRAMPVAGNRTAMISRRDLVGSDDETLLAELGVAKRVAIGSSLKFCRIARGDADVYPRRTSISEWDIAAGHAVLAASGGTVRDLARQDIRYGQNAPNFRTPGFIAAGNADMQVDKPQP